jgi:hypothetical protein
MLLRRLKVNYDTQIINENNIIKITWETVQLEKGRKAYNNTFFKCLWRSITNYCRYHYYFISIAENIYVNNKYSTINNHTI